MNNGGDFSGSRSTPNPQISTAFRGLRGSQGVAVRVFSFFVQKNSVFEFGKNSVFEFGVWGLGGAVTSRKFLQVKVVKQWELAEFV